jgi:hypothetical protein
MNENKLNKHKTKRQSKKKANEYRRKIRLLRRFISLSFRAFNKLNWFNWSLG